MKKYELKYTVGEDGVFAMSTVTSPAVLSTLVMFGSEEEDKMFAEMMTVHHEQALKMAKDFSGKVSEKMQVIIDRILAGQLAEIKEMKGIAYIDKPMQFSDDEKKIIYSVAMRPNMLIPRKNINGEPAEVFYSEETVKDLQQNFFKMNYHNGGTVNHGGVLVKDMYFFESWIVEDPTKDKATLLGLDVKKGDWVLGQKIDNPEVWEKVKKKELLGFSIEAFLNPILTNDNTIEMTKEEIDARIKEVILMTAEEDAAKKKEEEEAAAKLAMEEGDPTPPADGPKADLQKQVDDLTAENIALKATIAEMEGKAIEMASEVAASKKVAIEMGEEMAKGIKPAGNQPTKAYHEMSNVEKAKFNRGKL